MPSSDASKGGRVQCTTLGRRPQNRAIKKGHRPKNRPVLPGCPVCALFWLAALVSLSLVLFSWPGPGFLVLVSRSWSVSSPCCSPWFRDVSFRGPEVVKKFEEQAGADPITELSSGTVGRYGRHGMGVFYH